MKLADPAFKYPADAVSPPVSDVAFGKCAATLEVCDAGVSVKQS